MRKTRFGGEYFRILLVGYLFLRLDMEPAPLLLGFILGPMLEENFRRAMLLSRGSFSALVNRPISATLLSVIGVLVVWQFVAFFRARRKQRPVLDLEKEASAPG